MTIKATVTERIHLPYHEFAKMFYEGIPIKHIAEHFKVSQGKITSMIVKLNLKRPIPEVIPGGLPHPDKCKCASCCTHLVYSDLKSDIPHPICTDTYAGPSLEVNSGRKED